MTVAAAAAIIPGVRSQASPGATSAVCTLKVPQNSAARCQRQTLSQPMPSPPGEKCGLARTHQHPIEFLLCSPGVATGRGRDFRHDFPLQLPRTRLNMNFCRDRKKSVFRFPSTRKSVVATKWAQRTHHQKDATTVHDEEKRFQRQLGQTA